MAQYRQTTALFSDK